MSMIELVISMGILLAVLAGVAGSVQLLTSNVSTMAQTTQAINQEQTAEQDVVRDVHAAVSWCASPTTSELKFLANINGGTTAYDFKISSNTLTLGTATSCTGTFPAYPLVLLGNVDTSSSTPASQRSGFSMPSGPSAVVANGTSYYTSVGVTLTVDTPSTTAANRKMTTMSDPAVEIWNAEQACQTAWNNDPVGSDPC